MFFFTLGVEINSTGVFNLEYPISLLVPMIRSLTIITLVISLTADYISIFL
jgi:hypothetical protein